MQRRLQTREVPSKGMLNDVLTEYEQVDAPLGKRLDLANPWMMTESREEKIEMLEQLFMANQQGRNVQLWADWQMKYGDQGLSSNIVVPNFASSGFTVSQKLGSESGVKDHFRVIVANSDDAERIARIHVRKDGSFHPVLFDSVIATSDNEHWQQQRRALAEVFMPLSSLAKIMPVSLARAKKCAGLLKDAASSGVPVDMSDFFLHEAQAQLQLALLGLPESFMEASNADIRKAFMMHPDAVPGRLSEIMAEVMRVAREDTSLALPSDSKPVRGPLSRALQQSSFGTMTDYGNALIILFAGHDTTGHAMTWLLFELARHSAIQLQVQREIDEFFTSLQGKDPEYNDLNRMPFLDKCITETLRLWNSVPNGTFRQLQFDDDITGKDGKRVTLPKGTVVNVVTWQRHRNRELWGNDADEFNPYRHFEPQELMRVGCPQAAMNPQSERYSPFAHSPRSCLGKNFAQMEMRLIVSYLLRSYSFTLAPPYDKLGLQAHSSATSAKDGEFRGVNLGTMGPMDMEGGIKTSWGSFASYAMKMYVHKRDGID
eukprot:TRINITY_DN45493_c0_g1_i1.p1 TRINITY_DN45493_c0_g1~~TRINITY_DN45493_c0_g1_i1.p1  ORF type:complete len:625 (+),score=92.39 TRINITY_DN45493_c0_g1_i1:246-1877(+)